MLTDLDSVRACLHELAPDRIEVSDKLTLGAVGEWAARRRCAVGPVVARAHRRDPLAAGPGRRPVAHGCQAVEPTAAPPLRHDRLLVVVRGRGVHRARCGDGRARATRRRPAALPSRRARVLPSTAARSRVWCSSAACRRRSTPTSRSRRCDCCAGPGSTPPSGWSVTGRCAARLEQLAEGLPVTFTRHVHERVGIAALIAQADVALAPCPYETFGLAVLEALACGTPVVVADRGAARELLGGITTAAGRAVAPDPASFAAAVVQVLAAAPPVRRAMRARRAPRPSRGHAPSDRCCGCTDSNPRKGLPHEPPDRADGAGPRTRRAGDLPGDARTRAPVPVLERRPAGPSRRLRGAVRRLVPRRRARRRGGAPRRRHDRRVRLRLPRRARVRALATARDGALPAHRPAPTRPPPVPRAGRPLLRAAHPRRLADVADACRPCPCCRTRT